MDGVRADVVRTKWLANLLQTDRSQQRLCRFFLKTPHRVRVSYSGICKQPFVYLPERLVEEDEEETQLRYIPPFSLLTGAVVAFIAVL